MTSVTSDLNIRNTIKRDGFAIIKFPDSKNFEESISSLGEVILKTEIKENPLSTRLLASNQAMSFHTDHHQANYIAWLCNSQSSFGGSSLLVDTERIFKTFSEGGLALLKEITVKNHQVFYGDKLSLPLLEMNDSKNAVYYAQWLLNHPACIKHQKALKKFEDEIYSAQPVKILLSEGDVLIIDNHRMLHGREAFPANSQRWLTRFWLKTSNINNH